MKITNHGVDKDAARKRHNPIVTGKTIHCYDCGLDAVSEKEDFEGRRPRLSVNTYWWTPDQEWCTQIKAPCPNCGGDFFFAILHGDQPPAPSWRERRTW